MNMNLISLNLVFIFICCPKSSQYTYCMCVAFFNQLCDFTKSCKLKMRGLTLVGQDFRRNCRSYDHKTVSGDPGLHVDTFKLTRGSFVIKWQTSKVDAQGLFLPTVC